MCCGDETSPNSSRTMRLPIVVIPSELTSEVLESPRARLGCFPMLSIVIGWSASLSLIIRRFQAVRHTPLQAVGLSGLLALRQHRASAAHVRFTLGAECRRAKRISHCQIITGHSHRHIPNPTEAVYMSKGNCNSFPTLSNVDLFGSVRILDLFAAELSLLTGSLSFIFLFPPRYHL